MENTAIQNVLVTGWRSLLWKPFRHARVWFMVLETSSLLWDQTRGDILSSLHPRTGSQALSEKGNIAKPQQGRRCQWVPSAVPRDQGRLKKVSIDTSSFRPLLDLTWNLIVPPSSEPLLHLLLCEPFCLKQGSEAHMKSDEAYPNAKHIGIISSL